MNWKQFKKNVGMHVQLEPVAHHLDETGNELHVASDDWLIVKVEDLVILRNVNTGHEVSLGKDNIYDFRSNPMRTTASASYGFLVLKMQIFLQESECWMRPNSKPGERVLLNAGNRRAPMWTPFQKVDASALVPLTAHEIRIQFRLWSSDPSVPLMVRFASEESGGIMQELSGPSGVAHVSVTHQSTFFVSFSHPNVEYAIDVLGYEFAR